MTLIGWLLLLLVSPSCDGFARMRLPENACSTIHAAVNVEAVDMCMPFWLDMNEISDRSRSAECERWISEMMTFHLYRQTSPLVEDFLTKACSLYVPALGNHACKEAMRETITRVFLNSKNPGLVCQLLGDDIFDNVKTTPKTSAVENVSSAVNANVISCGSCVYVTNKIKTLLAMQRVEDNIETVLYKICEYMTDSKDTCNTVVHTDFRAFVRFLSHEIDAHGICNFLRFCEPTKEEKQTPLCPFCEYVIDRIQVCIRVTHWNDLCREVVQADAPALIGYLVRHMDAGYICEHLHFCPGHQNLLGIEQLSVTSLESETCLVCKPVVEALKHFLDRNSTKEEIALLLDLLCDLTVKYKQHCQQVVSDYLSQMIELLEKDADPELVCELLGLCSPVNTTEVLVTREPSPDSLCPFCVYLLHRLRDENKNDLSFPNILHALVRLCPMTGPMMYDCQKIIKGNERIIAKRMELAENDSLICQAIRICPRNSVPTEEVGNHMLKTEMPVVFSQLVQCASILANNSFYITPVARNTTKAPADIRIPKNPGDNDGVIRFSRQSN
ncbi:hypothetical protein P879_04387 [Paragonimus westermani]|uniref:Saposin B-type domain-containing protein n=1 Tax=Paragonimus westermani TaxID=34504 RepID=A0A8T0DI86_9TREM|nr:hypothetical protein P879_04387 [Paragonimus westermani]